mmetsp:Transcript_64046/g.139282  ORF Transcript_64046/g.139282 Transcript_64046/m.139282 type:complete len:119 (-) Transcript_64046:692-1048(-)
MPFYAKLSKMVSGRARSLSRTRRGQAPDNAKVTEDENTFAEDRRSEARKELGSPSLSHDPKGICGTSSEQVHSCSSQALYVSLKSSGLERKSLPGRGGIASFSVGELRRGLCSSPVMI